MIIQKFKIPRHMADLWSMLVRREAYLPQKEEMPAIGYIAFEDTVPVAACFLRKVEGGYGQLDGLTSNPHCSKENRHKALDLVVQRCIKAAEDCGIKHIISFTLDSSTTSRAEANGFVKQPHTVIALSIKAKV
jgi:hypothetical protein